MLSQSRQEDTKTDHGFPFSLYLTLKFSQLLLAKEQRGQVFDEIRASDRTSSLQIADGVHDGVQVVLIGARTNGGSQMVDQCQAFVGVAFISESRAQ